MSSLSAIILAAGKGTRMKSDLPKVAHEVAGRPMVEWVARACHEAGCERIIIVIGYAQKVVREIFAKSELPVEFVVQDEQHGTGHAVMCAADALADEAQREACETLVLAGDGPLISAGTITNILGSHRASCAVATLATAHVEDPTGYGRIVRDDHGRFRAIVEHKNATQDQLAIDEINPSYYCFDTQHLFRILSTVERNELTGEYYITDVPGILREEGRTVEVDDSVPAEQVLSINSPEQLAAVNDILTQRLAATREGA